MAKKKKCGGDSAVTRARTFKEKAKAKFEKMDFEGAYELYEKGLKILPEGHSLRAEFNSNIAAYFMMKENYNQAIIHCSVALDIVSDYKTKPLFRRARAYRSLREFEKAAQDVNEVLKREPDHHGAKELLAEITAENNHVEKEEEEEKEDDWVTEFETLFNSCVHLYDSSEEALEELASREEAQPIFDKAAAQFQEDAVTCLVNCGRVHLSLAVRHRNNFEVAIGNDDVDVEEILIDPEWLKRLNMAKEKFDKAFEIEPESYDVFLSLGEHQYEMVFLNYSMRINDSDAEQLGLYDIAEKNIESAFGIWKTKTKRGIQSINDLKISTSNKEEEVSKIRKRPGIKSMKRRQKKELDEDACDILGIWADILYGKSELEFAQGKDWETTLDLAIKKYQLVGFSNTQISELRKDHVSEENTSVNSFQTHDLKSSCQLGKKLSTSFF